MLHLSWISEARLFPLKLSYPIFYEGNCKIYRKIHIFWNMATSKLNMDINCVKSTIFIIHSLCTLFSNVKEYSHFLFLWSVYRLQNFMNIWKIDTIDNLVTFYGSQKRSKSILQKFRITIFKIGDQLCKFQPRIPRIHPTEKYGWITNVYPTKNWW